MTNGPDINEMSCDELKREVKKRSAELKENIDDSLIYRLRESIQKEKWFCAMDDVNGLWKLASFEMSRPEEFELSKTIHDLIFVMERLHYQYGKEAVKDVCERLEQN